MTAGALTAAGRVGLGIELAVGPDLVVFNWGHVHELGSAAYWCDQARKAVCPNSGFALGRTLAEEVVACLLGGHGMPAPLALAAFERLRSTFDLTAEVDASAVEAALSEPLDVLGRPRRYRFPQQRATRIASALGRLAAERPPEEPIALRDWLLALPGVGYKTASWIVRNHTGTDDVAIIDIHIHRAGLAAGFFSPAWRLPADYLKFECAFLTVAEIGDVGAARLDAHMWFELQRLGRTAAIVYGRAIADKSPRLF